MLISWISLLHGDKVAVSGFNHIEHFHLPLKGKTSAGSAIASMLAKINPKQLQDKKEETGLNELLSSIKAQHGYHLFIISDFYEFDQQIEQTLQVLSRKHQIVLIQVFDPLEKQAPKQGHLPVIFANKTRWLNSEDSTTKSTWENQFKQRRDRVLQFCQHHQISFIPASTEESALDIIKNIQHWWRI